MIAEVIAMMVVGIYTTTHMTHGEVTSASKFYLVLAIIMGICSAVGLLIQYRTLSIAPQSAQGVVVMIGGLFPVTAVVVLHVMGKLGFQSGALATPRQWVGVALALVAMYLIGTSGTESKGKVSTPPLQAVIQTP
jgi:hypothetical protein